MAKRKRKAGLTPKQLEQRRHGIGGSDIAAVAGLSPWSGPIDVYLDKIGEPAAQEENVDLKRGSYLEPSILNWYGDDTGSKLSSPGTLQHPEHEIVLATPDAIVEKGPRARRVVEAKAPQHTAKHWGQEGTDEIPGYYIPQVTWEMAVCELELADAVPLIYGNIRIYTIAYDHDLFKALLEVAMDFWHDHVVPRKPPPFNHSKRTQDYIRKLYPRNTKDMVLAMKEQDHWAGVLRAAQEQEREIQKVIETAKANLMYAIGEHAGMVGPWGRINYATTKDKATTNWKAIAQELGVTPEMIKKHTKHSTGSRPFRPYWTDEE